MSNFESGLSGTNTNAFLATLVMSFVAKRITEARIYHFDRDNDLLFGKKHNLNSKAITS